MKLKRLQAIAVSGCATSAFVKDTIDECCDLGARKVRERVKEAHNVIVSVATIRRYRLDTRSTCEICKSEYYAEPTKQTCASPECKIELRFKRHCPALFNTHVPAPKIKGPVDLVKLRSIANTCTSGWLYGQMGRG